MDKPDGANAIPDIELSAHYVICKDGRTITQEVCQADYIYSPVSRTCIQVNKGKIELSSLAILNDDITFQYDNLHAKTVKI